jgi:hypothetical protein
MVVGPAAPGRGEVGARCDPRTKPAEGEGVPFLFRREDAFRTAANGIGRSYTLFVLIPVFGRVAGLLNCGLGGDGLAKPNGTVGFSAVSMRPLIAWVGEGSKGVGAIWPAWRM